MKVEITDSTPGTTRKFAIAFLVFGACILSTGLLTDTVAFKSLGVSFIAMSAVVFSIYFYARRKLADKSAIEGRQPEA